MKELLSFIISSITGSDSFQIVEETESDRVNLIVTADPSIIGIIIGKEGKTIKNIRRILAIKATQDDVVINISVVEA